MSALTLADKIALIYTSAGSQRKIAALTGVSHQTIGRILHRAARGESLERYESRPELRAAIGQAFAMHVDITKQTARDQGLPFNAKIPIYAGRLEKRDGKLGDRVAAEHLHWLKDDIKNKWIRSGQKSGKYYSASAGSVVNVPSYMKNAERRIRAYLASGKANRNEDQLKARESLKRLQRAGVELARVYTPLTSMDSRLPSDLVIADLSNNVQTRHAPAADVKGTSIADTILLQVDTRGNRGDKTKQRKAAGNTGKTRKSKARK